LLAPPRSRIGPLGDEERRARFDRSPIRGVYDESVDRESAYEMLAAREAELNRQRETTASTARPGSAPRSSRRQSVGEAFVKSMARSIGSSIGRQILRGILGSITGGRR
jgi:hypothetical protein